MKVTIKDIVDFYKEFPEYIGGIYVRTRYGYKKIEYADVTAYKSEIYFIKLDNGYELLTSPDHLLMTNKGWKKVKFLNKNDEILTDNGYFKVCECFLTKNVEDLYDLQVEDVKEFYANGIVSHNSTLLDALTFVLYGKPYRNINKPQLVNSINRKNLLVEIEFDIGKNSYKVIRGIKPNVFEIYKNDELIKQNASVYDYQDYLTNNILGINYKTFCQVVILGSASYVPFMSLPPAQRRVVVENILDLEVFSLMNEKLKEKISKNKDDIRDVEMKLKLLKKEYELKKKNSEILKKNITEEITRISLEIEDKKKIIESKRKEIEYLKNVISELELKINEYDVRDKLNELQKIEATLNVSLKNLEKELRFYEKYNICPKCNQKIENKEHKHDDITRKISEINEKLNKVNSIKKKLEEVNNERVKIEKKYNETISSIKVIENSIKHIEYEITDKNNRIVMLNEQLKQTSNENIDDLKTEIQNVVSEYKKLVEKKDVYDVLYNLFKDNGVKSLIIKKYVPVINKLISYYLNKMDFYVNFELNETFEEIINSPNRENFSYESFSEGEKARINLAILFTWRMLAQMRNSTATNIMIFDEVLDSSTDQNGIEAFFGIIKEMSKDMTIFVISHTQDVHEARFDKVLRVTKNRGFSLIEEK